MMLSIVALASSGALALLVAAARSPIASRYFTDADLARRVLVVHVALGIVVWFSALPVALFHVTLVAEGRSTLATRAAAAGSWLAGAGTLLLASGLLPRIGPVHTVNYIPVVAHPLFFTGLALFFCGVAASYVDRASVDARFTSRAPHGRSAAVPLPDVVATTLRSMSRLVRLGVLYVLVACVALGTSLVRLPADVTGFHRYEILMWGPGHVLQFATVAFVLVVWALLAAWGTGRPLTRTDGERWVSLALALPLLPILVLVVQGPAGERYVSGFMSLMKWALFPAVLLFLWRILVPHLRSARMPTAPPLRAALWPLAASIGLMLTGVVYGSLIRGPDLRIPGHYHATIGAVTLAYMSLTVLLRPRAIPLSRASRPLRRLAILFGAGQFLFSTGLFVAGSFGLARKTYGTEQHIANAGQWLGVWTMAAGAILAFAGGLVWAAAVLRRAQRHPADHRASPSHSGQRISR